MRIIRIFLRIILFVLVIAITILLVTFFYIRSHPEEVLQKVLVSINKKQKGHLEIGAVDVSALRNLPILTLSFKDFLQTDSTKSPGHKRIFSADSVNIVLDVSRVFQKELLVHELFIQGADIQLLKGDLAESPAIAETGSNNSIDFKKYIGDQGVEVSLRDSRFRAKDNQKNKEFLLVLDELDVLVKTNDSELFGEVSFNLVADKVAFNLKNGSFFNGARLEGKVEPQINLETHDYTIPAFSLKIDDQVFLTDVYINPTDSTDFQFILENSETDFAKTRGLLTKTIQSKLVDYEFDRRLYTKSSISGSFAPGSQPFVNVDFKTTDNFATINDTLLLSNLSLIGSFQNRLSTKPNDHRNIQLKFDAFATNYLGSQIKLHDSYLTSTPEVPTFINFNLEAHGSSTSLNKILDNRDFLFQDKAPYDFFASFQGAIGHPKEILNAAESHLNIGKTSVLYTPTNLLVNTDTIALGISKEHALLESLVLSLRSGNKAQFYGDINHFTSLIFATETEKVTALLSLESEILDINDFLSSVNELNKTADKNTKPKGNLSATLQGIYNDFHPTVSIDIDSLYFRDTLTTGFYTGLRFKAANILEFEDLAFSFQDNPVKISGSIEVPRFTTASEFEEEVILDLEMQSEGKSSVFNSLFQNENFIFQQGTYKFDGRLNGNIRDSDEITSTATGSLVFDDIEMLYAPKQIQFPVKVINLELDNTDAKLISLIVPFSSGDEVNISGEVINFTGLLKDTAAQVQTNLQLNSEKLNYQDLLAAFEVLGSGSQDSSKTRIREAAKLLGRQFSPKAKLDVANFTYKNLEAKGLKSALTFDSNDSYNLNETGFQFSNGKVDLNAKIDLSEQENAPFDIDFDANKVDLNELLQTFDFFGLQSIKDIEKLDGVVSIKSKLDLIIREDNKFDLSTLTGNVNFNIENLELAGFEPLMKIGAKIRTSSRVDNIKFAPIQDSLFISRMTAYLPRIEIQSTGFDFFIEGQFSYEDKTNLWVSLPISNLKKRNLSIIPERIGYDEAGKKVFVHIFGTGPKELTYKFHLSDRKLYADKGLLPYRKEMKREERKNRRVFRRNRKKSSE